MKRKEMIKELQDFLIDEYSCYCDITVLKDDAISLLYTIEKLGMIPPAYVKTVIEGNLYSLQTINEWEEE